MKYFYLIFFAACFPVMAFGQSVNDTLFFEGFNNKTLDRGKWNVETTGRTVNNEQQAYVDSSLVLKLHRGNLSIRPVYHTGFISAEQKHYDFLSGRINTSNKFEFTYGTISARIKMPAGAGLW